MKYLDSVDHGCYDAFGRIRTASPVTTVFTMQNNYNSSPLLMNTATVGAGSAVTHSTTTSATTLTADIGNNDYAIFQSKPYIRYQPGKSQLILMTGVLGAAKANVVKRIGYFDNNDGLFFEMAATGLQVVRRSSVSGSPVDTAIPQASWNLDKLNGTSKYGITFDPTKTQIFVIDFQWLGVGKVRFGLDIDGLLIYCHEIEHANYLTVPYMRTANLPIRYEVRNTGAAPANATSMSAICACVNAEAGFETPLSYLFSASTGVTSTSVTTRRPVLSIRPKTTFNSITNRGQTRPTNWGALVGSNTAFLELVVNGTLSGGSVWTSSGTNSITEFNTDHTGIADGTILDSQYIPTGSGIVRDIDSRNIEQLLTLGLDIAGTGQDVISIVATSFTGTSAVNPLIRWSEYY